MSNLIKVNRNIEEGRCTSDSIKYGKDCPDFVCLKDGTITNEYRYCELSTICRQIDFSLNGKVIPMEAHRLPVIGKDGEMFFELFCTGMHDLRSLNERLEDDKVS